MQINGIQFAYFFFIVLCKLFILHIFSKLFYANYTICIFFFYPCVTNRRGMGGARLGLQYCIVFDITFVSLKMEVFLAVHSFKGTVDQPLRRALMMAFRLGPF